METKFPSLPKGFARRFAECGDALLKKASSKIRGAEATVEDHQLADVFKEIRKATDDQLRRSGGERYLSGPKKKKTIDLSSVSTKALEKELKRRKGR